MKLQWYQTERGKKMKREYLKKWRKEKDIKNTKIFWDAHKERIKNKEMIFSYE